MADWIFQAGAREHDLDASIAGSPERWWGTPRYRDRMAVGDRVWMQVTGPHHPGIYYVATIVSATYEHPAQPGEPAYARWRTDIRVDYRIRPPLLRSELLDDATLGSFRPFHGFQGSNVPVPPDIAAALSERAAPRLVTVPRSENGGHPRAR
jgi:EVE domain